MTAQPTTWHHCAAVRPCPSNTPREPGTPACVCGADVAKETGGDGR